MRGGYAGRGGCRAFPARPVAGGLEGVVPGQDGQQHGDANGDGDGGKDEPDDGLAAGTERQLQSEADHYPATPTG